MQYRKLVDGGKKLSVLGYGCMRFPTKNGRIDEKKALDQMMYAFNNGVNYYDTAYPYHGGRSEVVLGKFINNNSLRDHIYIADKLPVFMVKKADQIQSFFNTQLERLNTNYIDYYLMHMLDSLKSWERLKEFGIIDFIKERKRNGDIRHIGFSFHGRPEEFVKILEDYEWDFCQIQFNYLDEYNQAGLSGLRKAYELGIGVVVMEPLRGGNLAAKAPDLVKERFAAYEEEHSPAYWALRWIWNHKEVAVVLSGMNVNEHIKENICAANETSVNSMSDEEIQIIDDVKEIYKKLMKVPCTGCNYCMPCPYGVDIPGIFTEYNNKYFFGGQMARIRYIRRELGMFAYTKNAADLCTACGICEKHCPQNIEIRQELQKAHKDLDNKFMRFGLKSIGKIMGLKSTEANSKFKK